MAEALLFLRPLLATIVIEVLLACLLGQRKGRTLLLVVLVNMVTNPLLHLAAGSLLQKMPLSQVHWIVYAVMEPLVVLIEGLLYHRCTDLRHPYLFSLILNTGSLTGGWLWKHWLRY